jgi:hypothetical protein
MQCGLCARAATWLKWTSKPPIAIFLSIHMIWDKLAFRWPTDDNADMYLDGYLQFGMMIACEVFNRVGRAIVRMMMRRGHKCIVDYVDDFIIICENQAMAWYVYWTLHLLLRKLGF